ncbi:TetR/AcrR family transcriptional regulator [Amycolatopsis anabasis]|uniref:TetR/AcrR family transcriptional regulator n=1 Tax=Amycolatopsis anabasis TaxID=1840409 RepID=UPI001FE4E1B7|nr:TetR family transcriptional regulator [Amycolatopsis anabasis]
MADEQTLGLRERKKLHTRKALSDAALELVFERGLDNVRREDIAARVGVSVRTFNNYFASKYEALAYRQVERMRRSVALLRARPVDEPLWAAITKAILEPLEADGGTDATPSRTQLAEVRKLLASPEMQAEMSKGVFGPEGELVAVIAERTGTDPERDLYPRLVATAIGAAWQAASDVYLRADPPVPIVSLLRRALSEITAGLPDPSAGKR